MIMEAHGLTREAQPGAAAVAVAAEPRWQAAARRAIDLVFSTLLIALFSPLLLAVTIAVRLDSRGPAFFRQRRVGLEQSEFTLYKFRSMRLDADPRGHRDYVTALIKGQAEAAPESDRKELYKLAVDDRITPVGRWIRRWSIDELPQLFNVVLGNMSLVGPRPAISYEVDEYPSWYLQRFSVKPGLTGLWQVSGRNERTYEEMVRLDVEYVERRTLWLDISILFKTPWTVLSRKGAA
jgi:lipopolysaccharide/colanic/teichoic acid biosynthesis glycosyltransferase